MCQLKQNISITNYKKNWKMAAISLISIIQKKFQITDPPKVWVSTLLFCVLMETGYHRKTGDANFLFSEFSIGSFFPITLPRFHFNIYVQLHLKHLCVDIYASLVYPTSHLCVVLHFLIFFKDWESFHPTHNKFGYLTFLSLSCPNFTRHHVPLVYQLSFPVTYLQIMF